MSTPPGTGNAPVVVGWENTPSGQRALEFAVAEARLRQAPLVVVTTYFRPVDPDNDSFDETPAHQAARVRWELLGALKRFAASSALPPHRVDVVEGPPWKVLRSYTDAAVVVVGEHPRSGLRALVPRTTTGAALLKHTRVPVIVVPGPATSRGRRTRASLHGL